MIRELAKSGLTVHTIGSSKSFLLLSNAPAKVTTSRRIDPAKNTFQKVQPFQPETFFFCSLFEKERNTERKPALRFTTLARKT